MAYKGGVAKFLKNIFFSLNSARWPLNSFTTISRGVTQYFIFIFYFLFGGWSPPPPSCAVVTPPSKRVVSDILRNSLWSEVCHVFYIYTTKGGEIRGWGRLPLTYIGQWRPPTVCRQTPEPYFRPIQVQVTVQCICSIFQLFGVIITGVPAFFFFNPL